jgi:eukaryotic-like serine/threonine-protein kinase
LARPRPTILTVMEGQRVTLENGSWQIGTQIAEGGAGVVYEATRDDGTTGAAKFVIGGVTSQRELEFQSLTGASHVIPILDTGTHDNTRVIVMPRAESNLRVIIKQHPAGVPSDEVLPILRDIATGLAQLDAAGVVHRDIKPENILRYDGRWVLADFGIARHTAATTATHTHKRQITPEYASPEQWNSERATHRTDVYAFGITAYELLSGTRPFHAVEHDEEELARAHREEPVRLRGVPTLLYHQIEQCLAKRPESRPTAENLLSSFDRLADKSANLPGLQDLLAAIRVVEHDRDEFARQRAAEELESEQFNAMFAAAEQELIRISDEFCETINGSLPAQFAGATRRGAGQWDLELRMAKLTFSGSFSAQRSGPPIPYRLIAGAVVSLTIPRSGGTYTGRSHSLWYADLQAKDEFGWYELAFAAPPGSRRSMTEPYDRPPSWNSGAVLAGTEDHDQLAWPVTLWRPGDIEEPINRWVSWFAAAVDFRLQRPSQVPERPVEGTWRRPAVDDSESSR